MEMDKAHKMPGRGLVEDLVSALEVESPDG